MKFYSDGWLIGKNPSSVGGGYTIFNQENQLVKREEVRQKGFTNNEAELLGAVEALKLAKEGDEVIIDSMTVYWWIRNAHKIPCSNPDWEKKRARKDLDHLKKEGYSLMTSKKIKLSHQPRENNLAGIYNEKLLNS